MLPTVVLAMRSPLTNIAGRFADFSDGTHRISEKSIISMGIRWVVFPLGVLYDTLYVARKKVY